MGKAAIVLICGLLLIPLHGAQPDYLSPDSKPPILQSLIIPGWGEYLVQHPKRAKVFMLTESALWVSSLASFMISQIEEQKYIAFAADHAGVSTRGKNKEFWIDIGNYPSSEAFNTEHLRWRDFEALYPNTEAWQWEWDSGNNRSRFERIRIRSDHWALIGKFLIGGIVVNHIVSAIDVLYLKRIAVDQQLSFVPLYRTESNQFTYSLSIYF
ncbi:MAG: hypothetical protein GXO92_00545 [FCB group bacterium]|nr:hypothetical protein [FCB group bacterium]